MATLPPGLVWLASYCKSGNTWLRILLSNLLAAQDAPCDINDLWLKEGVASARDIIEYQTLVDSFLLTVVELDRLRPGVHEAEAARRQGPVLVKTHDSFAPLADGRRVLGAGARAALYLVRDPRDVAVSYSFHEDKPLDEIIRRMGDPDDWIGNGRLQVRQFLGGWSRHVASWIDQDDLPVHVIRYEDLLADTATVFMRALDFLGAGYGQEEVARAVSHARFEELRAQEAAKGFCERISETAPFFREGRAGGWRDRLSREQEEIIWRDHGTMMARLGYDV